jgi:serine/threonine protein kinase
MTNLIGKTIDRYHILEQLGEGGMATVYKAYDTRLERDVAVKIIRKKAFPEEQLDRILKRFEREAKALARLSHPNILKVHDYGEYEGSPYLVLEYLHGGTLKEKLKGKPMDWQDAIRILLPIAQALEYAHEHGIIHRDIKPSNILLTDKGQSLLSDFGIAKLLESEETATLTSTGVGVGTPEYMAPEQWTGSATAQSDIYSLGVVLYEMVTGRKPYTADTPAAILLKQASEPLPRPNSYVSDLPDSVEKVLLKALAKNPKDRYQDAGALVEGLEDVLIETSKSRNSSATPKVSRPVEPDLDTQDTYLQGETYATNLQTAALNYKKTTPEQYLAQSKKIEQRGGNRFIPRWRALLWITLGWIIGEIIVWMVILPLLGLTDGLDGAIDGVSSGIFVEPVLGVIHGTVIGFVTTYILFKEKMLSSWKNIFWITLGWALGGGIISSQIGNGFSEPLYGFILALVLFKEHSLESWKDIFIIIFGWLIGLIIAYKITSSFTYDGTRIGSLIASGIFSFLKGVVNATILIWALRKESKP